MGWSTATATVSSLATSVRASRVFRQVGRMLAQGRSEGTAWTARHALCGTASHGSGRETRSLVWNEQVSLTAHAMRSMARLSSSGDSWIVSGNFSQCEQNICFHAIVDWLWPRDPKAYSSLLVRLFLNFPNVSDYYQGTVWLSPNQYSESNR